MKYTVEQQRENAKRWIEALRSGEYRQGYNFLKQKDSVSDTSYSFCCLGVACNIFKEELSIKESSLKEKAINAVFGISEKVDDPYIDEVHCFTSKGYVFTKRLPDEVKDYLGLHNPNGRSTDFAFPSLVSLNDKGTSFERIADHLEAHWDQYFTHTKDEHNGSRKKK